MLLIFLFHCFFVADGLPFISMSELKECPHVQPMKDVRLEQISGSWRLAYLFYDEDDSLEQDGSCIVGEFKPASPNHISIAVHMDFKEDDFIIDRTSVDLTATYHDPSQWLLHSNSSHTAYLHAKVIHVTEDNMILSICISKAVKTDEPTDAEDGRYNYIFHRLRKGEKLKYLKSEDNEKSGDGSNDDLASLFGRESYLRRKRNVFEKFHVSEADARSSAKHLSKDGGDRREKHFWTVILSRDNNISAFNFVENAALLMKFGFDITKGNLVAFGKCDI